MSTTKWKPFLKYPLTALRSAGVEPYVQELSRDQQMTLLNQIIMTHVASGTPIPDQLRPPKPRKKRDADPA